MKTDRKGNYFLMGISPAEYRLKLEKPGFQLLEGRVSIAPGQNSVFDAVLAPEVTAGGQTGMGGRQHPGQRAFQGRTLRRGGGGL